jgi:hypothetical protein
MGRVTLVSTSEDALRTLGLASRWLASGLLAWSRREIAGGRDSVTQVHRAALGHVPTVRGVVEDNLPAGPREQRPHYVLYGRAKRRRVAVYVPEEPVPEVQVSPDNGRALQDLLHQAASRYIKALKRERIRATRAEIAILLPPGDRRIVGRALRSRVRLRQRTGDKIGMMCRLWVRQ